MKLGNSVTAANKAKRKTCKQSQLGLIGETCYLTSTNTIYLKWKQKTITMNTRRVELNLKTYNVSYILVLGL